MFLCAVCVVLKADPRSRLGFSLERKVRGTAATPGGQASAQGSERSHTAQGSSLEKHDTVPMVVSVWSEPPGSPALVTA